MSDPLCTCMSSIGPNGSFHRQCERCASGGYEWRLVPKKSPWQHTEIVKPVIVTNAFPCMCGVSYPTDTMGSCSRCGGKRS